MNVRQGQIFVEYGNLLGDGAEADLHLEEDNTVHSIGQVYGLLYVLIGHSEAIHAVLASRSLGRGGYVIEGRYDGSGRVGQLPLLNFRHEHREHGVRLVFPEGTHGLGIEVAVIGHDAIERQECADPRVDGLSRPEGRRG